MWTGFAFPNNVKLINRKIDRCVHTDIDKCEQMEIDTHEQIKIDR